MDINLELYKIFYYVCEFKNITKVANFLYVTQPAITRHIRNLEEKLGKTLIIRNTKGIELTNDGRLLYNKIKKSVEELISIETSFKEKSENYEAVIRIIAGHSTIKKLLLKNMSEFNKKYPNIKFEISTYPYQESVQRLREGEADLIFLSMNEVSEKYNNIIIKKCYELQDTFAVSKNIKDKFPDIISILDLNDYPTICKLPRTEARKIIEEYYKNAGLEFVPKYELSNNWLVEEYVKLNVGIGLVTKEFILDELHSGELKEIKTKEPIPKREIGYAIRKNCAIQYILKEFIKDLVKRFENNYE